MTYDFLWPTWQGKQISKYCRITERPQNTGLAGATPLSHAAYIRNTVQKHRNDSFFLSFFFVGILLPQGALQAVCWTVQRASHLGWQYWALWCFHCYLEFTAHRQWDIHLPGEEPTRRWWHNWWSATQSCAERWEAKNPTRGYEFSQCKTLAGLPAHLEKCMEAKRL